MRVIDHEFLHLKGDKVFINATVILTSRGDQLTEKSRRIPRNNFQRYEMNSQETMDTPRSS